jgi:hypothetical protein
MDIKSLSTYRTSLHPPPPSLIPFPLLSDIPQDPFFAQAVHVRALELMPPAEPPSRHSEACMALVLHQVEGEISLTLGSAAQL